MANRMPAFPVLTEVWVLHGLGRRQPLLVVVAQQLVEQVQSLRTHQVLVLRLDELLPAFPCLPEHRTDVIGVSFQVKGCWCDYRWTDAHWPSRSLKRVSSSM